MQYSLARTEQGQTLGITAKRANRQGLIAGATGTGKTVTLRKMAEAFSDDGVPVFLVDVKGDLSGLVKAGTFSGKVAERIEQFDLGGESYLNGYPVSFWDVFGKTGIPLRTTISEMGPLLLSRLLNLNATQEGLLNLVFRVADDRGLLLIDLKDLRAMLKFVAENAKSFQVEYGKSDTAIGEDGILRYELDEVLEKCDVLTLHVPLTDSTRNLINLEKMKKMKKSAVILNLARGPVINQEDLYFALKNKIIKSAAVDVTSVEPIEKNSKLFELDNILITPHIAWKSEKSMIKLMDDVEKNLKLFLEGKLEGLK